VSRGKKRANLAKSADGLGEDLGGSFFFRRVMKGGRFRGVSQPQKEKKGGADKEKDATWGLKRGFSVYEGRGKKKVLSDGGEENEPNGKK